MLVLSRSIGDAIKIGDDIEIRILDVNQGQVRIGISAPKDVNIVRSELLDRPRKQLMTNASVEPTYTSSSRPLISRRKTG